MTKKFGFSTAFVLIFAGFTQANETPAPFMSCVVSPDYAVQAGISKIEFTSENQRGLLTLTTTDSKGGKLTGQSTVSAVNAGSIALAQDRSNLPFVYQSYLTKTPRGWTLQKYWLCDFTYFEESCPAGDATILLETAPAACMIQ